MRRLRTSLGALALLALGLGGCAADPTQGYSAATTFSKDVSTVAVEIFENSTFERDIEFELTDALIKEIQSRTPYRVTGAARADSILTGRIHRIERDQLSKSRVTGLSEEVILSVTIDFQWKDQRTGRSLVERREFSANALFVPSAPSSERIELSEFAAVQRLARDIVTEMQADW